ncbi:MAG: hypothetical protein WCJ62_10245 [Flavobacterium sp.]
MKKIIATLFLTTVLSFTSYAQVPAKTANTKTEITEATISKDISDLTKTVTMDASLIKDFTTLMHMRAEALNNAKSEEERIENFQSFSRKLIGGFNESQLLQLKSNPELLKRLTKYIK